MRKALFTFLVLGLLSPIWGQIVSSNPAVYTPEQTDQLVAPIALYPDPLVALILPAATVPSDILLAAQYFQANGDPAQVDSQQWDESVRALAHYPDVIKWMNDNLDWTTTLGQLFLLQPAQVMESVQQMRAQARANGVLVDNPQQNVVVDGSSIEIVPAQPGYIYVPQYDPDAVFFDGPVVYSSPLIVFGPAYAVGPWLQFECDWDNNGLWIGTWRPGWDYLRDWRRPRSGTNRGDFWRADPARQRAAQRAPQRSFAAPPHPQPMAGAPRAAARPASANRAAPGNRPAAGFSSRSDTTGWRTDAQGHLAVTPAPATRPTGPAGPAGPQVVLSTPPAANRPPPAINRLTPTPAPPVNRPAPSVAPVVTHPSAPSPAPGALFGGYTRGTEARDFSNRGQSSIQASRPAPPAPRAAPSPPPRSEPAPAPSSNGGNNEDQRKHQ